MNFYQLLCLLLLQNIFQSFAQSPIEIRFQPEERVYSYQIASIPVEVHTLVLQNIAVLNTGKDSIQLSRLDIVAIRNAEEIQSTSIHAEKLKG